MNVPFDSVSRAGGWTILALLFVAGALLCHQIQPTVPAAATTRLRTRIPPAHRFVGCFKPVIAGRTVDSFGQTTPVVKPEAYELWCEVVRAGRVCLLLSRWHRSMQQPQKIRFRGVGDDVAGG